MYDEDWGFDLWQQLRIGIDIQPRWPPLPIRVQNPHSCSHASSQTVPFITSLTLYSSHEAELHNSMA